MHRKLINTFRAIGLVLSLATVAFVVAVPVTGTADPTVVGAVVAPAAVVPQAGTGSAKAYSRHRRAQAREAMALPFFSFAQGLRSGKRS